MYMRNDRIKNCTFPVDTRGEKYITRRRRRRTESAFGLYVIHIRFDSKIPATKKLHSDKTRRVVGVEVIL